jgi:hypothetical protein
VSTKNSKHGNLIVSSDVSLTRRQLSSGVTNMIPDQDHTGSRIRQTVYSDPGSNLTSKQKMGKMSKKLLSTLFK